MPRMPYVDEAALPEPIIEPIRRRRGGQLLSLDRMLLHSPAYAGGWNALLGAVRGELSLPARLRELAICAVARLTAAAYEWGQHAPLLLAAGAAPAQLAALDDVAAAAANDALFDPAERATLQLTLELTRDAAVSDATFAAARAALPDRQQLVELIGVIATYNMVSRFLVALGVELEEPA